MHTHTHTSFHAQGQKPTLITLQTLICRHKMPLLIIRYPALKESITDNHNLGRCRSLAFLRILKNQISVLKPQTIYTK